MSERLIEIFGVFTLSTVTIFYVLFSPVDVIYGLIAVILYWLVYGIFTSYYS